MKPVKRVIVCGGQHYTDRIRVYDALDKIKANSGPDGSDWIFVIHGGATGADAIAADWAKLRGQPCAEVEAPWDFYEKRAGPLRNKWMLFLAPDGVVAFPGNNGTRNMISQAREAGVPVWEVTP